MQALLKHPLVQIFLFFMLVFTSYSITTNINGSYGIMTVPYWWLMVPASTFSAFTAIVLGKLDGNDKKISHHWLRFITRGMILSIFPLAIHGISWEAFQLFFLEAALFWPTFNFEYNETRNHVRSYVGTEATFDKVIRWINRKTFFGEVYPYWLYFIYIALIIQGIILNLN